jgi:iron(III) transport system substrate-binding protein
MVVLPSEDGVSMLRFKVELLACLLLFSGCSRKHDYVVLYTSQDQFYAEPILQEFTAKTGIKVRPVFDTESAKTAALVQRLRAEHPNPQCDVFWSNEEMHTRLLVEDGLVANDDWRSAGSRTRRLVFNTNLVQNPQLPKSLLDLTNSVWNGRVAIAFPLFGTTKSHFLALRQLWGEELWRDWCYGLVRNGAKVVDGNSVVVRLVAAGECAIGLTDSDDIAAGLREGKPIAGLLLERECIRIPSTIALIMGAPRPKAAQTLIDFLSADETVQKLVSIGALEAKETAANAQGLLKVDWNEALKELETATDFLQLIFVRS